MLSPLTAAAARRTRGFTLVELLVVIGIIALLISILLPSLSKAREAARTVASLSNLRQLGMALVMYKNENHGKYPNFSMEGSVPKMRWADYIFPYVNSTEVFMSPALTEEERQRMNKPFAHTCDPITGAEIPGETIHFGGYGYNYQYLGNGRTVGGTIQPFHATEAMIPNSAETIAIADTNGSMDGGDTWTSHGVYAIDPPLQSFELGSNGSRKTSANPADDGNYSYRGGFGGTLDPVTGASTPGDPKRRATPAERNRGKVAVAFCDGHAETMTLKQMDDYNNDGFVDNGYWNGLGDPKRR